MPADDPATALRQYPCYLLYLGWRRAAAFYAEALGAAMHPQRMYVLDHLVAAGPVTIGDLATLLAVDPGTISGLCARMQRDGHLQRLRNPDNGKEVLVRATAAGRALHRRAAARIAEADRRLLPQLQPGDLAALQRVVAAFTSE